MTNRIVKVEFHRFKAFKRFRLDLKPFNIMVGANNAGKSTIISAFRILSAAIRRAESRKATIVRGPNGDTYGYPIELSSISVAEENIFFDYDDSESASITFTLSNGNQLLLYFPERESCTLILKNEGRPVTTPSAFKSQFNCKIGFVPILGPVEHNEILYEKEAARLALFNYRAARNFRNIWHHYPEKFHEFRSAILETWPGMDIEEPEISRHDGKTFLYMFCPEKRKPRELFWSGFGFQVWCQMLTHMIQNKDASLFLIDEPDIYLHSELQRQLLGLLRNLGPDVLVATHSTEIIVEAEPDDIILISKDRPQAKRIKNPNQVQDAFRIVGSNTNPILTQLAKTRRVIFVEGKDFQIISRFARKLGYSGVANRRDFAVVPVEGFNTEKIHNLIKGMEETLGSRVLSAAILDRDYRSEDECQKIENDCLKFCDTVFIHKRKEIENFLLSPSAIDRACALRAAERAARGGSLIEYKPSASNILEKYRESMKSSIFGRFSGDYRSFMKNTTPSLAESTISENCHAQFEKLWASDHSDLCMLPGKEAISYINKELQDSFSTNVTSTSIIDNMKTEEIPTDMKKMIESLDSFSRKSPPSED
ncbi:MAG: hypothetical protein EOP23_21710 [Hyphomicrobiales bacterium]|nr:MAG: hypothetical protein EOP23_21710 [Hyphomicrobiales bacterium]